jgi:hypothetical protein
MKFFVNFYYTPFSSGGFDWFPNKEAADAAFEQDKSLFADCPTTLLFQREHETELKGDAITDEIEGMQVKYEDEAYKAKFGAELTEEHWDTVEVGDSGPIVIVL